MLTEKKSRKEREREAAVRRWTDTPSKNPRYGGTTPGELARALLRRTDKDKKA